MDSDDLDYAMKHQGDFRLLATKLEFTADDTLYYFGNNEDADGALKTEMASVTLDVSTAIGSVHSAKTGGAEGGQWSEWY